MPHKDLLIGFFAVAILWVVLIVAVHFANSFFLLKTVQPRLSERDLLFVEGLLALILGGFLLIPEFSKPRIGGRQRLLMGSPSVGARSQLTRSTIHIALALIATGIALLVFAIS